MSGVLPILHILVYAFYTRLNIPSQGNKKARSKILHKIFSQLADFEFFKKVHLIRFCIKYTESGNMQMCWLFNKPQTDTVNCSLTYLRW